MLLDPSAAWKLCKGSVNATRELAMTGTGIISRAALMGAAVVLGGSVLAPSAWADTFTFNLTNPNPAIAGFPAPYAQVTITTPSANAFSATVTFTTVFSGVGGLYLMGDGGSADLNVSTTYSLSNPSASNTAIAQLVPPAVQQGFSSPAFVTPGQACQPNCPGNVDGFGNFNLSLNLVDGYTQAADTISFSLTDTSMTAWANAQSV